MSSPKTFSVGHSNHSWETFAHLLDLAGVNTIIDIRSNPRSRYHHFNQRELKARLEHIGLPYVYLGDQLGGQIEGSYRDTAQSPTFREGLDQVRTIALRCRPALLCAEHEPLECHRFLLVARALAKTEMDVAHILRDGSIESQQQTEQRLLRLTRMDNEDFLTTAEGRLAAAYLKQEQRLSGLRRQK